MKTVENIFIQYFIQENLQEAIVDITLLCVTWSHVFWYFEFILNILRISKYIFYHATSEWKAVSVVNGQMQEGMPSNKQTCPTLLT